jgi:hypothetical protein
MVRLGVLRRVYYALVESLCRLARADGSGVWPAPSRTRGAGAFVIRCG